MLPFLKRKQEPATGLIIKNRAPDQPSESEDKDDPSAAHEACAKEIIQAIESKDAKRLAEALKDMYQILESGPEEEGEPAEKHSYDAQNEKAGEQE